MSKIAKTIPLGSFSKFRKVSKITKTFSSIPGSRLPTSIIQPLELWQAHEWIDGFPEWMDHSFQWMDGSLLELDHLLDI